MNKKEERSGRGERGEQERKNYTVKKRKKNRTLQKGEIKS